MSKYGKIYDHFFIKMKSNVNLFWRQGFLTSKKSFWQNLFFSKKSFEFSHDLTTVFFWEKQILAKNFSLRSKILLSSKQIYIWFQFCEEVVVNFPMFWQIRYTLYLICQKHGKIYDYFFQQQKKVQNNGKKQGMWKYN